MAREFSLDTNEERQARINPILLLLDRFEISLDEIQWAEFRFVMTVVLIEAQRDAAIRQVELSWLSVSKTLA